MQPDTVTITLPRTKALHIAAVAFANIIRCRAAGIDPGYTAEDLQPLITSLILQAASAEPTPANPNN